MFVKFIMVLKRSLQRKIVKKSTACYRSIYATAGVCSSIFVWLFRWRSKWVSSFSLLSSRRKRQQHHVQPVCELIWTKVVMSTLCRLFPLPIRFFGLQNRLNRFYNSILLYYISIIIYIYYT